ncbi:uncharacterized protein NECHADRAFT_83504 [Fusarium vanettenii 77-13-4]|uniref:Uncharacterized protein n=1 Tax=Fusarium vanettenii (strain ATCC MYA-4622 / CBS 123669 / FGSC 9596 / NRRL 45880 / 77-13-4) TaxID=660122 RepID=C7Z473_FUSV7|nr:uncharacterized protein NECHADRAFT_83504 [Fusarium vanettenii 77-13-4]EEU41265.1 predicted protein [Fusarium vanettenii 77-13-4]
MAPRSLFVCRKATYADPVGDPESGVRDIFRQIAPEIVYKYFVIGLQSAPHAMNIYATLDGEEITGEDMKRRYAHSFILFPLELRLQRDLRPNPVSQEDKMMEILQAGVINLSTLSALVCAFKVFEGGDISKAGDVLATTNTTLHELTSQLPWLKGGLEKARKTVEEGEDVASPDETSAESLASVNNAAHSFEQLHVITRNLEPRLTRLSNGENLTNQGIVDTMLNLRQAMVHLSRYEQSMQVVDKEEFTKWDQKVIKHQTWQYAATATGVLGVAAIVIAAILQPDILTKLLAETLAGGSIVGGVGVVATLDQKVRKDKAMVAHQNAKDRARRGRIALREVKKALEEVRTDLATIFIVQVMRQHVQGPSIGRHELEQAITMLGGDLGALGDSGYDRALIGDRMRNLAEKILNLDEAYQQMLRDLNLVMDEIGRVPQPA